jgi:hypothetical protein
MNVYVQLFSKGGGHVPDAVSQQLYYYNQEKLTFDDALGNSWHDAKMPMASNWPGNLRPSS